MVDCSSLVFNRCFVRGDSNGVLSCLERERLEEELSEARSRGKEPFPAEESDSARTGGVGRARAGGADAAEGPRRGAWVPAVDVVIAGSGPGLDAGRVEKGL